MPTHTAWVTRSRESYRSSPSPAFCRRVIGAPEIEDAELLEVAGAAMAGEPAAAGSTGPGFRGAAFPALAPFPSWSYRALVGDAPLMIQEQVVLVLEEAEILEGLALTTRRSAYFPGSTEPISGSMRRDLGIGRVAGQEHFHGAS